MKSLTHGCVNNYVKKIGIVPLYISKYIHVITNKYIYKKQNDLSSVCLIHVIGWIYLK